MIFVMFFNAIEFRPRRSLDSGPLNGVHVMYSSAFSVFLVNFSSWVSSTDLRFVITLLMLTIFTGSDLGSDFRTSDYSSSLRPGPVNHFPRQRTAEVAR